MTHDDWQIFVNEGVASNKLIVSIAYKIYSGTTLNDKEMSVYKSFSSDIEGVLGKIQLLERYDNAGYKRK